MVSSILISIGITTAGFGNPIGGLVWVATGVILGMMPGPRRNDDEVN